MRQVDGRHVGSANQLSITEILGFAGDKNNGRESNQNGHQVETGHHAGGIENGTFGGLHIGHREQAH